MADGDDIKVYPMNVMSGVKRDGTEFDGNYYKIAQWCRWQRGKPRKIGGYRDIFDSFSGISRGMHIDGKTGNLYIYSGSANKIEMAITDSNGDGGLLYDRTPASFTASSNNVYQFDGLFDAGGDAKRVIVHAGQNLSAIDSTVQSPIFYGDEDAGDTLLDIGTSVSGGVVSLFPYLLGLDNAGLVMWTPPNTMSFSGDGSGSARICANKLIKGCRIRGGSGYSPSGLLWSVDELYRAYFIGGAPVFAFDFMAETVLLSTSAVVEYNGRIFWPDINCFKVFNGAVEDLVNDMNVNYFYDNLNRAYRQKVWGIKIPRFNEIWYFWPKGNATECTDVLIYNIKEQTWYDTAWAVDQLARSAGIYSDFFPYPLMMGMDPTGAGTYKLWQHEYGVDRIENGQNNAIQSNFTTCDLSYCANLTSDSWIGVDRWVQLMRIEPDFVQVGDMTVQVTGQFYAQDTNSIKTSDPSTFSPTTGKVDMKEQRREMRLIFESNVAGGDYQLGQTLLHLQLGDGRQ